MFSLLLVLVAMGGLVLNFWFQSIGIALLLLVNVILWLTLAANRHSAKSIVVPLELSLSAREVFEKYIIFFTHPFASRDYASAAAGMRFLGIAVALMNDFVHDQGYYVYLIACFNWASCAYLSHSFNPLQWLHKSGRAQELEEISTHMRDKYSV